MIDVNTPEGQWLHKLGRKLERRQWRLDRLWAYYTGEPPMPEGMQNLREIAWDFFRTSRTNFAELVAEAPRERMKPTGIRTSADDGESGDREAWKAWTSAGLAVVSADVHEKMCALGDGYAIVSKNKAGRVVVTAEDPRQCVTIHDPLDERTILAGLKMFRDEDAKLDYAYLYLPGMVLVAQKKASRVVRLGIGFNVRDWAWNTELSGRLPAGFEDVMPIVRFCNRGGVGEFERHTDLLDRINRTMLREMVVMTFQAFKQRAVMGDLPEKDEAGQIINYEEALKAGPDALWLLPPEVKIWESGQVDMNGILAVIKNDVLFLAAVTRTPLVMLTPDAATQSAEGASLQREGLVFKTDDRIARATAAWAQVMSLVFRFSDDPERAAQDGIQVLWAPVERYGLAEMSSAWSQFVGLPFKTKLRLILRLSPDEMAQVETERTDDLMITQALASADINAKADAAAAGKLQTASTANLDPPVG